jgi:multidrug efflux pump subunit AcrB
MFIALKPLNQRPGRVSADQVVNRLRGKLSSIPGAILYLQVQQEFQSGGRGGAAQYQYTLSDENLNELSTWAPQLLARMRSMPELRDVNSDQQNQGLAANLVIDRDAASRLGITAAAIDSVLYDAFGQREVSTMYTALNQYFVVMEVDPKYQQSPDALNGIFIKSSTGAMVPLSTIAKFEQKRTALQVNHQGQYPAITLSFQPGPQLRPRRRRQRPRKGSGEMGMPPASTSILPGNRAGLQDHEAAICLADYGRADRGLHCPRHSLREPTFIR